MTTIETSSFQSTPPVATIGCCDRISLCLAKVKKLVLAFFRYFFCCQATPQSASERILCRIAQDPKGGQGFITGCNGDAAREASATGYVGHVNWVPGKYDLWMKGVALVIAHLKSKYGYKDFYACETLNGFAEKLHTFANTPGARRGAFIVPTFAAGTQRYGEELKPDFPQHKVAVLVEKETSGQVKLVIMDPQSTQQTVISPQNIEGNSEIWKAWNVEGRFNPVELILRAVLQADLPKNTQLYYSTVYREFCYGCAHYALQDGVAFLRDPHIFDGLVPAQTGTHIGGMTLQKITQLPPAFMIGTQSLKALKAYKMANQGKSLIVKQKGQSTKTLSDYQKKYVVNGRNHYISVKIARYYQIVFGMLKQNSPAEIEQCLSQTLIK